MADDQFEGVACLDRAGQGEGDFATIDLSLIGVVRMGGLQAGDDALTRGEIGKLPGDGFDAGDVGN